MKRIVLIAAVIALSACGDKKVVMQNSTTIDQCLRAQLFNQCIKQVPPGPLATKYNDWDEVVAECGSQARMMSYRTRDVIKPECRSD